MFSLGRLGRLGLPSTDGGQAQIPGLLPAGPGTFSLVGSDTGLLVGRLPLTAALGTFTETGQAATLLYGRSFTADAGTFTVTGQAATLTPSGASSPSLDFSDPNNSQYIPII